MNLKESFQYMNHLTDLLNFANRELRDNQLLTTTKETHYKSKVIENAKDEEIIIDKDKSYTANQLLVIFDKIIEEMEVLSTAISEAKRSASIDIDSAASLNKKRQMELTTLKNMAGMKSTEEKKKGCDYTFNNERNQVPYYYDVKAVTTIDFDRNEVKKKIKTLSKKCDAISLEIDKVLITTNVDFNPTFDLTDTLEDIIE